jgi:hypothetical protein
MEDLCSKLTLQHAKHRREAEPAGNALAFTVQRADTRKNLVYMWFLGIPIL